MEADSSTQIEEAVEDQVLIQFVSEDKTKVSQQYQISVNVTVEQLTEILNQELQTTEASQFAYWLDDKQILTSLDATLLEQQKEAWLEKMRASGKRFKRHAEDAVLLKVPTEETLQLVYRPQAVFRVRPITRCSSSLSGHAATVLCAQFSPDSTQLVTGSADHTIRVWDLLTETCMKTLSVHRGWVQVIAWAPNSKSFVSCSADGALAKWRGEDCEQVGDSVRAHSDYITSCTWEPYHLNPKCQRFATCSKDKTVKLWKNIPAQGGIISLSGHTDIVRCVRWSGQGLLYSCGDDQTVIVWNPDSGEQLKQVKAHGQRVTQLSFNTDFALRTGPFDHTGRTFDTEEEALEAAKKKYQDIVKVHGEVFISSSDDNTMYLWYASKEKMLGPRLTGHVNWVYSSQYSPDGCNICSASRDKLAKVWKSSGKHVATLVGHTSAVTVVAWSPDSRYVITGSQDSTLKLWDISKPKKPFFELPGHSGPVFAMDWSPDGSRLVSGSQDATIRIWKH